MNKTKALTSALKTTPWFLKNSWIYIRTSKIESKFEFIVGVIPAWYRFIKLTYIDNCRYKDT